MKKIPSSSGEKSSPQAGKAEDEAAAASRTTNQNLDEVLVEIPDPVRCKISVAPLPKNMDPNQNKKRREERIVVTSYSRRKNMHTAKLGSGADFLNGLPLTERDRPADDPDCKVRRTTDKAVWQAVYLKELQFGEEEERSAAQDKPKKVTIENPSTSQSRSKSRSKYQIEP
ncbi:hypothetical protein HPB49_005461 [Dermacentor silvarum]|uniref:Uncharacterized protein n=1 Tax=Dermacentor silvarum TaxID=543639 RepID=A0ACB8DB47_DERSI|nr:hypothetical protein HPB49_005461 [Dermacentor silvarum]